MKLDIESTKKIHQCISILFVFSIIIKTTYLFIKNKNDILTEFKNFNNGSSLSGTVASFFVILINLLSIPIIRKKFFEIFYYSHRLLSFIILILKSSAALPKSLKPSISISNCICLESFAILEAAWNNEA